MARTRKDPQPQRDIKNPTGEALVSALAFVRARLASLDGEMDSLKASDASGHEWQSWFRVTWSGLKQHFGAHSEEIAWCVLKPGTIIVNPWTDPAWLKAHDQEVQAKNIDHVHAGLKTILEKYEVLASYPATISPAGSAGNPAKAFVSHGGFKESLRSIEDFLRALGVEPVVVERGASEGREVHGNVDHHRENADFAIVIWTKDIKGADGKWMPSGSVAMEAGELRVHFKSRIIFLAEQGVDLHTLGKGITYEPFSEGNLGGAFRKIVTELRSWGWLSVTPVG